VGFKPEPVAGDQDNLAYPSVGMVS
jgi:hypothetical protein